jgi:serine/threonine protein kinase
VTKVKKDKYIGRYKLGNIISDKGGFGIVYKTVHPEFKKEYAIKVFRNDRVDGEQMLQKREIINIAELSKHNNIVHEIDAGEDNGKYFMVMELMDGGLDDWIGKLPLEQAEWVFREVAEGLKHIHDNGYIHQRVFEKPSH